MVVHKGIEIPRESVDDDCEELECSLLLGDRIVGVYGWVATRPGDPVPALINRVPAVNEEVRVFRLAGQSSFNSAGPWAELTLRCNLLKDEILD